MKFSITKYLVPQRKTVISYIIVNKNRKIGTYRQQECWHMLMDKKNIDMFIGSNNLDKPISKKKKMPTDKSTSHQPIQPPVRLWRWSCSNCCLLDLQNGWKPRIEENGLDPFGIEIFMGWIGVALRGIAAWWVGLNV